MGSCWICFILAISLGSSEGGKSLLESPASVQPEQIHLSLGNTSDSMMVTWSTRNSTNGWPYGGSYVLYGKHPYHLDRAEATQTVFVDGGELRSVQYIQRAKMSNLEPDTTYVYMVGSSVTVSNTFFFRTFPDDPEWKPHFAIYGDLGNENGQSLPRLQRETMRGEYDAIIHVGDFAYDLNSENGAVGDEFMKRIEPIAAHVPYMTCPGNHEAAYNFSHYKNRFTMPEERQDLTDMFYSFNVGPVHFVSIMTEYYYGLDESTSERPKLQRKWLEEDLKKANDNRANQPWIIIFGHRPMYCDSNADVDEGCDDSLNVLRLGVPEFNVSGFEDLLFNYEVDCAIWAHEHNYERLWPLYDVKVMNGSLEEPYVNPKATVHVITGSAGCKEYHDEFEKRKEYTAFRAYDYGYTKLKAHNGTHLEFSQVSEDKNGKILDHFWLIKHRKKRFVDYNAGL